MVTFTGPHETFAALGCLFRRGEPRPVPPGVAEALRGHPWFTVDVQVDEPAKPKRGRPRKVVK